MTKLISLNGRRGRRRKKERNKQNGKENVEYQPDEFQGFAAACVH